MMRIPRISCVFFLGLAAVPLFCDTIPGGDVSGTWYAANSPYYINGNITVQSADTLTIEPGVDVIFLGYYRFQVLGYFEAVGSVSDSIRFMPQDTLTGWQSLSFSTGLMGTCHLSYADVRYAYNSGIRLVGAMNTYISHCLISRCRGNFGGGGIFLDMQSDLRLSNSVIERNTALAGSGGKGGGICLWNCDSAFIDSCTIRDNRALITIYTQHWPYDSLSEGGGIFSRYGSDIAIFITNSTITGNQVTLSNGDFAGLARGGGIYIGSTDTKISGCAVWNNVVKSDNLGTSGEPMDGSGIYLNGPGPGSNTIISRCDISRNQATALGAFNIRTNYATIENCTFFGNTHLYGLSGYAVYVANGYGAGTDIVNCVLAYNGHGISGQSTPCRYGDIYQDTCWNMAAGFGVLDTVNHNGDSCDVYYNIFADPAFADTANFDLHLTAGSPCIDAGDPASPRDPDSTIADQGCYWYNQVAVSESQVKKSQEHGFRGATIFAGPLVLPGGCKCRVFDIAGRTVAPATIRPGIYFIEIDGKIAQRVIKIR